MKVTTYAVMAGVVLALGLLPSASEAYCPCAGTPGNSSGACAGGNSNPPTGPNGCTADPSGLLPPTPTDGKGCIEITMEEETDCSACIGGSVFGGTGMLPPDTDRGVQGCTCTMTMEPPPDDYVCICVDTTTNTVGPCTAVECEMLAAEGCA